MNTASPESQSGRLRILAANLRQMRRNKGISVRKAAKATGMPLRLLWKVEHGLSSGFDFAWIEALRTYYDVSFEEVFKGI